MTKRPDGIPVDPVSPGYVVTVARAVLSVAAAEEAAEETAAIATPTATAPVILHVVDETITTSAPQRRSSTSTIGAGIERGHAPVAQLRAPHVQPLGPVQVTNPGGGTPSSEAGMKQWKSQILRATDVPLIVAPSAVTFLTFMGAAGCRLWRIHRSRSGPDD